MSKEITGKDRPFGLVFFSIFLASVGLSQGIVFFTESNLIFINYVVEGYIYKTYKLFMGFLFLLIAYGVLELKRWSYIWFATLTIWFIFSTLLNILFTTNETLVRSGWSITENSVIYLNIYMWASILLSILVFLWLHRYKKNLTRYEAANKSLEPTRK